MYGIFFMRRLQINAKRVKINGENNYFIMYKDYTKANGMVNGMEYPYDGLLISRINRK